MLVGVTFGNYMSFYENAHLSLFADNSKSYKEINTFNTAHGRLLKNCLIYGANGSGKSNLVEAIDYIKTAITIPFDAQAKFFAKKNYFKFNTDAEDKPMEFSISFIIDEVMYEYSFSIAYGKVIFESLYKRIKRNESNIFIRTASRPESIVINDKDFDNVKYLIQNTREDVLFLSFANAMNNDIAKKICDWFEKIKVFTSEESISLISETVKHIQSDIKHKKAIIDYLRGAGIEIDGLDLDQEEIDRFKKLINIFDDVKLDESLDDVLNYNERGLVVDRKVYDSIWQYAYTIKMKMKEESSGTQKFFRISGPIMDAIKNAGIVVLDEIDAKLHPALVKYLIMSFNSIDKNPNNAQLICTTHNINLLEEKIRKDQVYFINKNEFGVSDLYCLSDFENVKKSSKILKQYLLGAFGALPTIEE